MLVERNTWVTTSGYPYVKGSKLFQTGFFTDFVHSKVAAYISDFAMLYYDNSFIIFGNHDRSARTVIARFDLQTTSWSKLGDLKLGRAHHSAIFDGEVFLIVGGSGDHDTEKCSLSGSTMTCSQQSPKLNFYYFTPALVMVPEDFCTEI